MRHSIDVQCRVHRHTPLLLLQRLHDVDLQEELLQQAVQTGDTHLARAALCEVAHCTGEGRDEEGTFAMGREELHGAYETSAGVVLGVKANAQIVQT